MEKNVPFFGPKISSIRRIVLLVLDNAIGRIAIEHRNEYPSLAIFAFDHVGLAINSHGRYENDILNATFQFLKSKELIGDGAALDVGANIGNHSVFFANYFNKVVSFEPHPKVFKLLTINTEDLANIEVRNFGLSDKSEASSLTYNVGNYGGSSLTLHREQLTYQSVDVQLRPLDDEMSTYDQPIVLIKIDVEGHEAEVLKGAKKVILANKPTVLFEQQVDEIVDGTSETIDILRGYGYRFFSVENRYTGKSSKAARLIAFIKSFIFGHCKVIAERKTFEKRHYEQLIAIHDGIL